MYQYDDPTTVSAMPPPAGPCTPGGWGKIAAVPPAEGHLNKEPAMLPCAPRRTSLLGSGVRPGRAPVTARPVASRGASLA